MKFKYSMIFIILISFFIHSIAWAEEVKEEKGIILIDPGHGGIDGGSKSKNGTVEKDINLSIALKLKKALDNEGYKTFLTREDDTELSKSKVKDLTIRCDMKKETKCDIFISIHQNKFPKESCFGAQVWYADNDNSLNFAKILQESLRKNVDNKNKRLEKPAKKQYKILRDGYDGASVILECGFLSNTNEEQKLKSDDYQEKIVYAIVQGINEYMKK